MFSIILNISYTHTHTHTHTHALVNLYKHIYSYHFLRFSVENLYKLSKNLVYKLCLLYYGSSCINELQKLLNF